MRTSGGNLAISVIPQHVRLLEAHPATRGSVFVILKAEFEDKRNVLRIGPPEHFPILRICALALFVVMRRTFGVGPLRYSEKHIGRLLIE